MRRVRRAMRIAAAPEFSDGWVRLFHIGFDGVTWPVLAFHRPKGAARGRLADGHIAQLVRPDFYGKSSHYNLREPPDSEDNTAGVQ